MSASSSAGSAGASNSAGVFNKWSQSVLQSLARAPLSLISEAVQKDESGACRIRSGETKVTFNEALAMLNALGFKAVPTSHVCVNRERYAAVAELAQAAMSDPEISRRLMWDET